MIDFSVSLNWIYYKARQIDVIETAVLKELIYFKKLWVSTVIISFTCERTYPGRWRLPHTRLFGIDRSISECN